MEPTGRHVLVTGASRGLGLEMARALAQDGWTVFAGVRSPADGQRLAALSPRIVPLTLDVTDGGQIAETVRAVSERTDRLDGLVNNAGVFLPGSFEQLPMKELLEMRSGRCSADRSSRTRAPAPRPTARLRPGCAA
jgi:NAD(P)-dependent dehydrogenase (short-subunit alcohol dehydrogenase family)